MIRIALAVLVFLSVIPAGVFSQPVLNRPGIAGDSIS